MPAPLDNFLRAVMSGGGTLTPEMYDHFGGDGMLAQVQKFDPGAHLVQEDIGGGEGGSQGTGYRLVYDQAKMPTSKSGTLGLDLAPSNLHANLRTHAAPNEDANYGSARNTKEFAPDKKTLLEVLGPLFVSMVAPMAGAALAANGIGAGASAAGMLGAGAAAEVGSGAANAANWAGAAGGAAGGTAAATGSGLTGVNSLGLPDWALSQIGRAPQTAKTIDQNGFNPMQFLPMLGQAFGINPSLSSGGLTLASLARASKRRP